MKVTLGQIAGDVDRKLALVPLSEDLSEADSVILTSEERATLLAFNGEEIETDEAAFPLQVFLVSGDCRWLALYPRDGVIRGEDSSRTLSGDEPRPRVTIYRDPFPRPSC